jgi:hypothetical protein
VESKHIIARNSPPEKPQETKAHTRDEKDEKEPPDKDKRALTEQNETKGEDGTRPAKPSEGDKDQSEPKEGN